MHWKLHSIMSRQAPSSRRHNQVVKILYELCQSHRDYIEVSADQIGVPFKPIDIVSQHAKGQRPAIYPYHPDVWAKLKRTNTKDTYEVWDGQSASDSVGDIVLSALTPSIRTMSMVCFDQHTSELAETLAKVILPSIRNEKGAVLLSKDDVLPYIVTVPEEIQRNDSKLREFLSEKLNLKSTEWGKGRKIWYSHSDDYLYEAIVKKQIGNRIHISITDKEWTRREGGRLREVTIDKVSRRNK